MYFQIHKLMQRFPSENTLFTKDVGTQDQVLWLKLMMLGIKVTDAYWVQILPIGAFYSLYFLKYVLEILICCKGVCDACCLLSKPKIQSL